MASQTFQIPTTKTVFVTDNTTLDAAIATAVATAMALPGFTQPITVQPVSPVVNGASIEYGAMIIYYISGTLA